MNHLVIIKTKIKNKNKLLLKLYKNNIDVYDIKEEKDYLYLKINSNDYEKINKQIVTVKFEVVDESGIYHFKRVLIPLKLITILLFLIMIFLFSNIILSVSVIHSNKEIRNLITNDLEEYGLVKGSIKKDFKELEKIKEQILDNHKDKLEWIEIESVGMKYIVRVEERIINEEKETKEYCHIVASKSGVIAKVITKIGEKVVNDGDYVREGDILISGEIKYNDEVKANVCASGSVYAEVWYTTNVSLPLNYTTSTKTGKKRYNLMVETPTKKYKIFKSRLENYETEEKSLFKIFNYTFYQLTEYEVVKNEEEYTMESGLLKALELADEKINAKLGDNEEIRVRKVLKKTQNNSTIDVEIFYAVVEDITKQSKYEIEEEVS